MTTVRSVKAAVYRVYRSGKLICTFQNSTDAIIYADEQSAELGIEYVVMTALRYDDDTWEETEYMVSRPIPNKG